jgi:mandelamide amidase
VDADVLRPVESALQRLVAAGAELVEVELGWLQPLVSDITDQVQNHDLLPELSAYLAERGASFADVLQHASPDLRARFHECVLPGGSQFVTEAQYRRAVDELLPRLRAELHSLFESTGAVALIFPATRVPAPPLGVEDFLNIAG